MAKTRLQLRTDVETITGRTDKDDVVNLGLDFGLLTLGLKHNFREMRTLADLNASASDLSEALPSDFYDLLEARLIDDTNSYPLIVKDKKWVTDRWSNISADSSTKPDFCYVEGGSLFFSTPLDAAYTIRITYFKLLSFTDDTTVNPIPIAENALTLYAIEFLYNSLEMFDTGLIWKARADRERDLAIRADKKRVAEVKKFVPHGETVPPWDEFKILAGNSWFRVPDSV